MKLHSLCFGLLLVMFCEDAKQPAVVSDFCQQVRPEIAKLQRLSHAEIAALSRLRKEAIVALKRKYARACTLH